MTTYSSGLCHIFSRCSPFLIRAPSPSGCSKILCATNQTPVAANRTDGDVRRSTSIYTDRAQGTAALRFGEWMPCSVCAPLGVP